MFGNVLEWCMDGVDDYKAEPLLNPDAQLVGSGRVLRGGAWNYGARFVRAAFRFGLDPGFRDGGMGFRVARGPGAESARRTEAGQRSGPARRGTGRATTAAVARDVTPPRSGYFAYFCSQERKMRLHFLPIPVHSSTAAEAELNHFLATHRVLGIDRQFISDGSGSSWALCISYVEGSVVGAASAPNQDSSSKKRLDYRDLLPPAEFLLFVKLRDLRKQLAEREGVPPYAVFTNEQLAEDDPTLRPDAERA